ncbi:alpha-amylase [Phytoactinopolyspora alkaliphila]|uniref:Alpha-amylase n=1 Tax=Phytoactinopolyspora alkaliphila TaxID=1783498 RepID=A0A6N9YGI5_9ACTN|nr:alpha-amylase family glycosyl hydrolase [Phytoactinopolyspora alkaliphila]NED94018.1 alpha-amylase [Phytoactinopolyspora alkaliphila]
MPNDRPWWLDAVGYEVYVPSFQDSDGDGWGDLPGLHQRLDYLHDLGVSVLWISAFFPSPMRGHGNDVADYRDVDARYGTLADVDALLDAAHTRGMHVVADLVVTHTSNEHPWFANARDARYRDYYIWHDPAPDGGPPNNWLSHTGGPAWTLDRGTGQYYLHLNTPHQPDLNWANPAVAEEFDQILRFWLDRGLDGFRIDAAHFTTKHADLPGDPLLDADQVPETAAIHRRWRRIADAYDALLVGEMGVLELDRLTTYMHDGGLHSAFWFGLAEADGEPSLVADMLRAASTASPHLSWTQSRHGRPRAVSRYTAAITTSDTGAPAREDTAEGRRRVLAIATLTMGLPGIPSLYYGEELGLTDAVIPASKHHDSLARTTGGAMSREGARTPMPWEPSATLGFTTAERARLPFGSRDPSDTVAAQRLDPASCWSVTRRLLHARRRLAQLRDHSVEWFETTNEMIAYRSGRIAVIANLSGHAQPPPFDTSAWTCVFDTDQPPVLDSPAPLSPLHKLSAGQAVILSK